MISSARQKLVDFYFLVFILLFSSIKTNAKVGKGVDPNAATCSRTCAAKDCASMGLRYGKYCGVGWGGCAGEEPCDDLDACCKGHDDCVTEHGLNSVACHETFKACMVKVQRKGGKGFSEVCPYRVVIPTMMQGMELSIMLSRAMEGQGGLDFRNM